MITRLPRRNPTKELTDYSQKDPEVIRRRSTLDQSMQRIRYLFETNEVYIYVSHQDEKSNTNDDFRLGT